MRLRTLALITTLGLGLLAAPLCAEAQAGKVLTDPGRRIRYRIGHLGDATRCRWLV